MNLNFQNALTEKPLINLQHDASEKKYVCKYDEFLSLEVSTIEWFYQLNKIINNNKICTDHKSIIMFDRPSKPYILTVFDRWLGNITESHWKVICSDPFKFHYCSDFSIHYYFVNKKTIDERVLSDRLSFENYKLKPFIVIVNPKANMLNFIKETELNTINMNDFDHAYQLLTLL